MRKNTLFKEAFVATLLIFLLFWVISFFPFRFELIKTIRQGLHDFDVYDLYFAGKNAGKRTRDTNIVIVQLAESRHKIAKQLETIINCKPEVIGMDIVFKDPSEQSVDDSALIRQAISSDNIIWASVLKEDSLQKLINLHSFFNQSQGDKKEGFINFPGKPFYVVRSFLKNKEYNDTVLFSFPVEIVKHYSSDLFTKFSQRKHNVEAINYSGNLESYTNFTVTELDFLARSGQLEQKIRGKIVLMGYFNREPPFVLEDMHFTPLNERAAGRSHPDMYGVVIHANIISMILGRNYIRVKSSLFSTILALIFTFFLTLYILYRYKVKKHPSHGAFILFQILLIIVLTYIFLMIFSCFKIQVPLMPIILSIVISVEMIGLYKSLALWLNKRWSYKTIFKN